MLDDLYLFMILAESGSFAKAANRCNIYQSKLSRRLQALEQELGQVLVDRSIKNTIVLTESGKLLYDKLHLSIANINNKLASIDDIFNHKVGELRLVLPPIFANEFILPKLNNFIAKYPSIKLNILYSVHDVSLLDGNFDLALSNIMLRRGDYKIRTVCLAESGLFASTKYLQKYGMPQSLEDLNKHKVILPIIDGKIFNRWVLLGQDGVSHSLLIENEILTYDSALAGINLVKNDLGILLLLKFHVKSQFENGELKQIFSDYSFQKMPYYMIKPYEESSSNTSLLEGFLISLIDEVLDII